MSFLAPAAFVFAAALPAVVFFYLLKRRRTTTLVSSTLLWERFLAEARVSAPFRKLRLHALLFFQLLAVSLAVLALARPYLPSGAMLQGRLHVVILDGSASMQATDVSPSRFEAARKKVLELIRAMRDRDRTALILAAGHTEVKQSPTSNKARLRAAAAECRPADAAGDLTEALRLAKSLVRDRPDARIHLFSDGVTSDLSGFESQGLRLLYHPIGVHARNVGLTAFEARADPEEPGRAVLFVKCLNASSNATTRRIELYADGRLLDTRAAELGPRGEAAAVFALPVNRPLLARVRLAGIDDLAADDEAWAPLAPPRPARVLLITQGNPFLEKALSVLPNIRLAAAPDMPEKDDFDIVVVDNVIPRRWPEGNVLAFGVAPTNVVRVVGSLEQPPIADWQASHPLLRFVRLENVRIAKAVAAQPARWLLPIIESREHPLAAAGERGGRRWVWTAFDPLESTWPLRVSYPIFIANAVQWLNPVQRAGAQRLLRTGEPFRCPLPRGIAQATIRRPSGAEQTVEADPAQGELVFGGTEERGVYTVRFGTNQVRFAANLLSAQETDLRPRPELALGRHAAPPSMRRSFVDLELWRWAAALGLLILLAEWWYYHKRTV